MENIEYTVNEQAVNEQGSTFEVMNTDGSVNFSAYEDPREACYTTISEHEELVYDEPTITDNDDKFYDALEDQYDDTSEYDQKSVKYVRMKNYEEKDEWSLWNIASATEEEVSSVLSGKDSIDTKTVTMNIADTLDSYSEAA